MNSTLDEVLGRARELGLLGPGEVSAHIDHSLGFCRLVDSLAPEGPVLDLGSGSGVPGLVLAARGVGGKVVLAEANTSRCAWLGEAVARLGLGERVEVLCGPAEEWAHDHRWRGRFRVVVARGFGPPGVVAEVAAGFLADGGWLIVSEPPAGGVDRWTGLDGTDWGFSAATERVVDGSGRFAVMGRSGSCPAGVPRVSAALRRRPVF